MRKSIFLSAINATQVEVEFGVVVDKAEATTTTNYSIDKTNPINVELSEDGKTATLTFTLSIEGENLAVVVEPITIASDDNYQTTRYAGVLTYTDKEAPTVTEVESITGTDIATSVKVTFSEPVDSIGAIKINGVALATPANYTLTSGDEELSLEGLNLDASKTHTLEMVNLKDQATKANVTDYINETFEVTIDKIAPTVESIEAKSDTALVFTFSKKVVVDTNVNANTYIEVYNENLQEVTNALGLNSAKFSEVTDSKGTKWEVEINDPFDSGKDTAKLTVKIKDKTIVDPQGNKIAQILKDVTINRDKAEPKLTKVNYRINTDGEVKEIVFTFDEDVDLPAGITTLANILGADVVNLENGVKETLTTALGISGATLTAKDDTIIAEILPAKELSGNYRFTLLNNVVEDKSLAKNKNKADSFTLNFGDEKSEDTFKVTSVSEIATNVFTVSFAEAVKGGTGANSATLLGAYTLNGKALPSGTAITLNSQQNVAEIMLPDETIEKTDTAAIFVVKAGSIVSKDGKKMVENYTTTIDITDNISPELKSVVLTSDNNLLVEFSEKVTTSDIADFEITINDTKVAGADGLTITPGTGSDSGKWIINLSSLVKYDDNNSEKTEIVLTNGNIEIANTDVTSTFKYATSSVIDSIIVKTIGSATVDGANNGLVQDTVITVK